MNIYIEGVVGYLDGQPTTYTHIIARFICFIQTISQNFKN